MINADYSYTNITFKEIFNPLLVNKQHFYSDHNPNTSIFILEDNQNHHWQTLSREDWRSQFLSQHKGFRNSELITHKEIKERNQFHSKTPKDLFYQFNHFYTNLPLYITHFQIRKNLKKLNKEIFYPKQYGIESFDTITHKQQTLVGFNEEEANMVLCFDLIQQSNGDFLLCIGKTNSVCELLKITYADYSSVKANKVSNINPEYTRVFSLKDPGSDLYINYLAFIPNNRLVSVSNDQCLRMYDLTKENSVIWKIANEAPINHFDINEEAGLIVCVGDSCSVDILDLKTKGITKRINEHYDYGVVVKFNPYDSNVFATGNQDYSCRIWDIRKLDRSVHQLHGFCDSIGDLAWVNKECIVYGENALFAHVYNTGLRSLQSLEYHGRLSGALYDEGSDKIYCGVYQAEDSGIMEYSKINHSYCNIKNYDL